MTDFEAIVECHETEESLFVEYPEIKDFIFDNRIDPEVTHTHRGALIRMVRELREELGDTQEEVLFLHNPHSGEECRCHTCKAAIKFSTKTNRSK